MMRVSRLIICVPVLYLVSRKDAELACGDGEDALLLSGITRTDTDLNSAPSSGSESQVGVRWGGWQDCFRLAFDGWVVRDGRWDRKFNS